MKFFIAVALYSVIFSLISFCSGKKISGDKTFYISSVPDSKFINSFIGVRLSLLILLLFGNKKLKPHSVGPILLKYVSGMGQSIADVFKEIVLSWLGSF